MTPPKCLLQCGQTILFEGDSLTSRRTLPALDTWPFARLCNWDRTYADDVAEWLFCNRPDLELTFRNNAVSGSNIRGLLGRFSNIVPAVKPSWIILTIGNNDPNQGVPPDEFARDFREYCRRAMELCGARVVFLGWRRPCPSPQDRMEKVEKLIPYHEQAQTILSDYDGVFVDIGSPLTEKLALLQRQHALHTIYSDGGHLNAVGSLIVATQVLAALGVIGLP